MQPEDRFPFTRTILGDECSKQRDYTSEEDLSGVDDPGKE